LSAASNAAAVWQAAAPRSCARTSSAPPRDQRPDAEVFDVVGTEEGAFGCIGLLGCDDFCPKDLPLAEQLAYVRRKMLMAGLRLGSDKERDAASAGATT
jgi:succinate dehydrogenase/fumarate reductase-like Fe-S protein